MVHYVRDRLGVKEHKPKEHVMDEEKLTLSRYIEITTDSTFLAQQWKERGGCVEAVEKGFPVTRSGAIRYYNPMDWFPNQENHVPTHIGLVCRACPVRIECLVYAIYTNENSGIWGGYAQKQIRKMRRRIRKALRDRMRKR